jgi:hypothetical protein
MTDLATETVEYRIEVERTAQAKAAGYHRPAGRQGCCTGDDDKSETEKPGVT